MKSFFLFSVLLILGTTLTVSGQDLQGMFSLSPFAGIGLPMGDMAENSAVEIMEDRGALYVLDGNLLFCIQGRYNGLLVFR